MRKRLLFLLTLLILSSATRTVVHAAVCSTPQAFGTRQVASQKGNNVTKVTMPLPYPVQSGNMGWAFVRSGAATISVTDDQSNTYTRAITQTHGDIGEFWYSLNITNGTKVINVNVSGGGGQYVSGIAGQACGVGALDVTGNDSNPGWTTPNVGTMSPASGALMFYAVLEDDTSAFLTSITPHAGWTLQSTENSKNFQHLMWKVHTSGSLIASAYQATLSASRGGIALFASFTASSGGTAPPAGYIDDLTDWSYDLNTDNTPWHIQAPIVNGANAQFMLFEVAPGIAMTTLVTTGNTWTFVGNVVQAIGGGTDEFWKSNSPTASAVSIVDVNYTGSTADNMMTWGRVVGAAAGQLVTQAVGTATGNDAVVTSVVGGAFTPSSSNSVLIKLLGVESKSVLATDHGTFWSAVSTPNIGSPAPLMQNNGYSLEYSPATSSQTSTWTMDNAPNHWQELSILLNLTASSSSGTNSLPLTGVGNRKQ